jgi:hypothetical protein
MVVGKRCSLTVWLVEMGKDKSISLERAPDASWLPSAGLEVNSRSGRERPDRQPTVVTKAYRLPGYRNT